MSDAGLDWDAWIDRLRRGDESAVLQFCATYGDRLERLADSKISPWLRRRVGPEDVVQSVCRTFVRRAQIGQFDLPDSGALWALLCAITLSKVRRQARFHQQQRRAVHREQHIDSVAAREPDSGRETTDETSAPDEAVEFADHFQQVINNLDEEERLLVDLKLQQMDNDEIAREFGCSERTIRRLLNRLQSRLEREFLGE